jgi:hypothetical protein
MNTLSGTQGGTGVVMWDMLGMTASTLCIAHCVAMPFVLPFLVSWGLAAASDESVHHTLLAVIMALGALAFIPGYRKHRRGVIFAIASAGLVSLLGGAFYAEAFFPDAGETLFTVIGGSLLVTAHWLNRKFCTICPARDENAGCCIDGQRS